MSGTSPQHAPTDIPTNTANNSIGRKLITVEAEINERAVLRSTRQKGEMQSIASLLEAHPG
jgi:hypothetical protein